MSNKLDTENKTSCLNMELEKKVSHRENLDNLVAEDEGVRISENLGIVLNGAPKGVQNLNCVHFFIVILSYDWVWTRIDR